MGLHELRRSRRSHRQPRAQPAQLRIAAIDRDSAFLEALSEYVRRIGWTLIVHGGAIAHAALLDGDPHAVLVDISLLGPHWDEWLTHHPARSAHLGVVVCTGGSTAVQRIRGLHAGADDWVTKPCDVEEVCARLQAVVRGHRRGAFLHEQRPQRGGELELRPDLYDALAKGRRAGLTRREFDLLEHLASSRGTSVAREQIYRAVWGFEMVPGDRSIDTFVRKIRTKLAEVSPGWRYVHTHKGRGYSFAGRRVDAGRSAAQDE
jgi:DNA-binding response OmpR family regulator